MDIGSNSDHSINANFFLCLFRFRMWFTILTFPYQSQHRLNNADQTFDHWSVVWFLSDTPLRIIKGVTWDILRSRQHYLQAYFIHIWSRISHHVQQSHVLFYTKYIYFVKFKTHNLFDFTSYFYKDLFLSYLYPSRAIPFIKNNCCYLLEV